MGLLKEIRARQNETPPPAPDPAPEPPDGLPPEPGPDGITRRLMFSNVLGGIVPLAWTQDGKTVFVDNVCYSASEVKELMARNVDAATLRAVHETKKAFDATIN